MVKTPTFGDQVIEYVEESVFGTLGFDVDSSFNWLGLVNPFSPSIKSIQEETRYLGDSSNNHRLELYRNTKIGGELTASFTYNPQDWGFMEFIMGHDSSLNDTVKSFSMLQTVEQLGANKFIQYKGCMLTKWALTIPKNGLAAVDVDVLIGDISDPSSNDPSANGHASESATAPFTWEDLSAVKMDASANPVTSIAHIVGDIKVEITNTVEQPKDVDSAMFTHAASGVVVARTLSVSLELIWVDQTFYNLVKNGTKQNLAFTIGGKTFTITGLKFPEFNPEMKPSELVGQEVTAVMDLPALTKT